MRNKFLIFDTNHHAEFCTKEVKDGKITINDKEWVVDKAKPLLIPKGGFLSRFFGDSIMPLYLLKWNILLPVDFEIQSKKMKYDEMLSLVKDEELKEKLSNLAKEDVKVKDSTWELKTLDAMDVKFPRADAKENDFAITPEFLKSTSDMRFLKNMKNYASGEGTKFNKKRIMDIAFIGGMIIFVFISMAITGVIK